MQIVYCDTCGLRVSEADLKSGAAIHDAATERNYCPKCVPAARTTKVLTRPASGENVINRPTRATPVQNRVLAPASSRAAPENVTDNSSKVLTMVGAGAGLLGVVLLVFAMRGGKKELQVKSEPATVPPANAARPIDSEKPKPVESAPELRNFKPAESPATPAVAAAPVEKPAIPARKEDPGMDDIRENFAKRKWLDLKNEVDRGGTGDLGLRKRVKDFAATYFSTAVGKEAAEYLKKFTVNEPPPPGATVFASYKRDFKPETSAAGWRYLWNQNGSIGEAGKYAPLVWNPKLNAYSADADNHPVSMPAGWVLMGSHGGHPGGGSEEGAGVDRYAIAAYTLEAGQSGKTAISGTVLRTDPNNPGKIDFKIYVNDVQKMSTLVSSSTVEYIFELGVLKEGDTVYAAVGPDRNAGCDSYNLDFTIYPIP